MDTSSLTDDDFWKSDQCLVMANLHDAYALEEAKPLLDWARNQEALKGHILFATSGSTGGSKWVAISRNALLASAHAVNEHLSASASDRWLLALPHFHVGGMGILARSYEVGCDCVVLDGRWNAASYHALACKKEITLSSLVPTQLVDLVTADLPAPPSLRAVLIGGGRLADSTYQKAIALGWPVMETYGMTETSSQVATTHLLSRDLHLLPCWQAQATGEGRLVINGAPLATCYIDQCKMIPLQENGWFTTGDLVELSGESLLIKGRADRCVKILGELVNLDEVESAFAHYAEGVVLTAVPDDRRGCRVIACSENQLDLTGDIKCFNAQCCPVDRIDSFVVLERFPRSALGKIQHAELARLALLNEH